MKYFTHIYGNLVIYPPGSSLSWRKLNDFEFVYIHRGSAEWQFQDREGFTCRSGSLVLLQPSMLDYIVWDQLKACIAG